MTAISIRPQWQAAPRPFKHTWEGLVNIDQFRWMVRRDVQEQLKMAHDELGARHVRAVGMFDDELRVLAIDPTTWRDQKREPRVNWQIVDYIIESLLDIGINPMFTTTFVPGAMASGERTVFSTKGRISLPKDWNEWERFVADSVRHMIERFGFDVVKSWYFEVWNEPNLENAFFEGKQSDFWRLWQSTFNAIKSVDAGLRVGGPSAARAEWIGELLEWSRAHDCPPDYIITHVYNNDSETDALSPFAGSQEDKQANSPHFASGVIRGVRELLNEMNFGGEVHWNEWGRSWHPSDAIRESANEAAWVVKTMAEVSQEADYFAYWCLSDVYDQLGYGRETFHGNYGMLNLQGLRKPNYQAFQLLSKLGTRRVACEVENGSALLNALATTDEQKHSVLLYEFAPDNQSTSHTCEVLLPPDVTASDVKLWRIGAQENNILADWRAMGEPAYLRREQLRELQAQNRLQPVANGVQVQGNLAKFGFAGPGVALLECTRRKTG
jgi:xylan 1,4-beta-xylosidase